MGGGIGIGDGRKGGVKATFNGKQQPLDVVVDPKFLFNGAEGVISIDELNEAISDAVQNGYELSTKLMEEQIKGLYEQLGLSKEPQILPTDDWWGRLKGIDRLLLYEMRLDTTYMMKEREKLATNCYLGFSGICLVDMLPFSSAHNSGKVGLGASGSSQTKI